MYEHLPFIIGKILFGGFFIASGLNHFFKLTSLSAYAKSKKVPKPTLSTILSGGMLLFGGIGVLFEYHIEPALILLVLFLVPTSILMHNFWTCTTPEEKALEMTQFMKNIALAGACLLIYSQI